MKKTTPLYYGDYLQLDKILHAQLPQTERYQAKAAHDETLFIIVHQIAELWFLQIRHELQSIINYLNTNQINDNHDDLYRAVQRLDRVNKILRQLVAQFDVLETMQPLDFMEFRKFINPASGFQSKQFRLVEIMLGLQMESRHMPEHYKNTGTHHGGFTQQDYDEITEAESRPNLLLGVKRWLHRMPFFSTEIWEPYGLIFPENQVHPQKFLSDYYNLFVQDQQQVVDAVLSDAASFDSKKQKVLEDFASSTQNFRTLFMEKGSQVFTAPEMQAALFINLYRHAPILRLPYQLISGLIEIDDVLSTWRFRHYSMVKKMIGTKPGTGGSPGAAYLLGALQKNVVFSDLTLLPTYFIERGQLPNLPPVLQDMLQFKPI